MSLVARLNQPLNVFVEVWKVKDGTLLIMPFHPRLRIP